MKSLMTRWNLDPLYPKPSGSAVPSFFTPVASARKFSAVLGTVYSHSLNTSTHMKNRTLTPPNKPITTTGKLISYSLS